eukprot:g4715.t1
MQANGLDKGLRRRSSGTERLENAEWGGAGAYDEDDHDDHDDNQKQRRGVCAGCMDKMYYTALFAALMLGLLLIAQVGMAQKRTTQRALEPLRSQETGAGKLGTDDQADVEGVVADDSLAEAAAASAADAAVAGGDGPICAASNVRSECHALASLATSTNVKSWEHSSGWLDGGDLCKWYGITCENGVVVELDLYENKLTGSLPTTLHGLAQLRTLSLNGNAITGTLPADVINVPSLTRLDLAKNQFHGKVPATELPPALEYLFLNHNSLSGGFPGAITRLERLRSLYLCHNQFEGPVPPLRALGVLEFLDLNSNQFSGGAASMVAESPLLQFIDLSHNRFDGALPISHPTAGGGHHEKLTHVLLNNNNFVGPIPEELHTHKPSLHSMDLGHNQLRGPVLSLELRQLEFADFSHNRLTGSLPRMGKRLKYLSVSHNQLSGTFALPRPHKSFGAASWADMAGLIGVHAEYNQFDSIEESFCSAPAALFQSFEKGRLSSGISQTVLAISQMLSRLGRRRVIRPDTPAMEKWDLVMITMLGFVALLTPFEISLLRLELQTQAGIALFTVNRIVDVVFLTDMALNFFLMYPAPKNVGGLVKDHRQIVMHYLKGWFFIDLLSIIPFDLLVYAGQGELGAMARGDAKQNNLRAMRLVRLLRLLKLLRILRATRVWKRVESRISIAYAWIEIFKFLVLMFVYSHFAACMWVLMATLENGSTVTWVTHWNVRRALDGQFDPNEKCLAQMSEPAKAQMINAGVLTGPTTELGERPWTLGKLQFPGATNNAAHWNACYLVSELYFAAGYWSVMTLTTIGYGDITPVTREEHIVAIIIMLIGGCLWAYILGSICAAAANLDPHTNAFHCMMDELNRFMRTSGMPTASQNRFRAFFIGSRQAMYARSARELLDMMSPAIAAECVVHTQPLLTSGKIFFLRKFSEQHLVRVVRALGTIVFGPSEVIELEDELCILKRGIVTRDGIVMLPGTVWGEDFLIDASWLKQYPHVFSMTLCELSHMHRESMVQILRQSTTCARRVRKNTVPFLLVRAMRVAGHLIRDKRIRPTRDDIIKALRQRADLAMRQSSRSNFSAALRPPARAAALSVANAPSSREIPDVEASAAVADAEERVRCAGKPQCNTSADLEALALQTQLISTEMQIQNEEVRRLANKLDYVIQHLATSGASDPEPLASNNDGNNNGNGNGSGNDGDNHKHFGIRTKMHSV